MLKITINTGPKPLPTIKAKEIPLFTPFKTSATTGAVYVRVENPDNYNDGQVPLVYFCPNGKMYICFINPKYDLEVQYVDLHVTANFKSSEGKSEDSEEPWLC